MGFDLNPFLNLQLMDEQQSSGPNPIPSVLLRARRNTGDLSPFNSAIFLREHTSNGGGFELYNDDDGAGLV
ncbi:hypothetical protein L6452_20501 [Arctium lappa]|uniref:Uncharacterized protein n=1 Tax=Arctium lappa TaxID=4217 RepID=A0ACB9BB43_ARCLA|nr:hypothetical protein L6452_20501 [Arctium lappa]